MFLLFLFFWFGFGCSCLERVWRFWIFLLRWDRFCLMMKVNLFILIGLLLKRDCFLVSWVSFCSLFIVVEIFLLIFVVFCVNFECLGLILLLVVFCWLLLRSFCDLGFVICLCFVVLIMWWNFVVWLLIVMVILKVVWWWRLWYRLWLFLVFVFDDVIEDD